MEHLKLTLFISKIVYQKYNPLWFILYIYLSYLTVFKRIKEYKIKPLSEKAILEVLKNNQIDNGDINNSVVVNVKNIYQDDVVLKLFCAKTLKSRAVLISSSTNCDLDTLYVSECFYFNLLSSGINTFPVHLTTFNEISVNIAQEIDLSLISSPYEISNSLVDTFIKSYFKTPKIVCKNDIIEINIKIFSPEFFYTVTKLNHLEYVYFKCNKVVVKSQEVLTSYFCVIGETAVKQSVNIQHFLPSKNSTVVSFENFREIPRCPYGLDDYFVSIEKSVTPFSKNKNIDLYPIFLLQGELGCGKEILISTLASKLGFNWFKVHNSELSANIYAQNETKTHNIFFSAKMAAPCILSLHEFENFGKNNEGQYDDRIISYFKNELKTLFSSNKFPIILFCCSSDKNIPPSLKRVFLEIFEMHSPNDKEREEMIRWILEKNCIKTDVDLSSLSNMTHGFYFEDLKALVYYAEKYSNSDCLEISEECFLKSIDYMQSSYNESLGAPKVPKVYWSDVGGLTDVKNEITKTINLPLKHPEFLKKSGLKRSGILLFGPPGTGKTLLAKAVATECNLCFLSVKGPELLNMYVGQSEQNVREVFERAREASPCIIFFDELDSLAPNRGLSGDSGGVMDRVVSQLLAEMDGLNDAATVFIIGATNRPDLIDPALLRPGRFDKLLYVGPCTDTASKVSVLKALTRKFHLDKDADLEEVVNTCPDNITGADFYGICASAWSFAARRLVERVQKDNIETENLSHGDVIVNFNDFKMAITNVKPSVTQEDLRYFENLKKELSSNK